jgi:hypothetical protein
MRGFQSRVFTDYKYDSSRPARFNMEMIVAGSATEIEVNTDFSKRESQRIEREARKEQPLLDNAATSNVVSFQRRVAGDLPIRVEVPRTGNSYRFVRPLVIDEETKVTFQYKRK